MRGCVRESGSRNDAARQYASSGSNAAAARIARQPTLRSAAKIETQSSERQAGTTPRVLISPRRRLEADRVGEAGGYATRSRRVGAEREGNLAERDGDGRTAARAAGNVAGIEGIGHGAIRRARADKACRELVEIGLADANGARTLEQFDDRRRSRAVDTRKRDRPPWCGNPATSMLSLTANGRPNSGSAARSEASSASSACAFWCNTWESCSEIQIGP